MMVTNTNELMQFIDSLKEWAKKYSCEPLVASIESVEKTSFTASELIIKYTEVLKVWQKKMPENLPHEMKASWPKAIEVGELAVKTVEYEEKKRSLFSLG